MVQAMSSKEIRFHGRGGQGAVLASGILAQALVEEGRYAVAIPSFGFERRGAPVAAFLRVSDKEIRAMTNIYHPDVVICIDPTITNVVDIFAGMKEGGTAILTSNKPLSEVKLSPKVGTVGLCDAVGLAMPIFKRPITNSIMLGAFAKTTGLVSLASLKKAIENSDFRDAGLAQNLKAVEEGYEKTVVTRIGS
jgi:phenylglyoxylate dehydrogenase gamma subunit